MATPGKASRDFWDQAARSNAAWYIATRYQSESEAFFRQGADETDHLLAHCGITVHEADAVLEIGCGVGRMTRRLCELAGHVTAVDVSSEMLGRCTKNTAEHANVTCVLVPGDGTLPGIEDGSIDLVFSYITLQHVPTRQAQVTYLKEAARVMKEGGKLAVQVRDFSFGGRVLDWAGHLGHATQRRRTLSRCWRGSRLSDKAIRNALEPMGVAVAISRLGRHRWVIGVRRAAPAVASRASGA